jgi:hypothetical protein
MPPTERAILSSGDSAGDFLPGVRLGCLLMRNQLCPPIRCSGWLCAPNPMVKVHLRPSSALGGAVAWRTALTHPARADKLIVVEGRLPEQSAIGTRRDSPVSRPLLMHTLSPSLVEQSLHNVFGDPGRITPEVIDRAMAINQREGNRLAVIERFRQRQPGSQRIDDDSLADRIAELKLPTLIIWGGRDRLVPKGDAGRFHRDIAGSVLVMFDDLGHVPEQEDQRARSRPGRSFSDLLERVVTTGAHTSAAAAAGVPGSTVARTLQDASSNLHP